MKGEEQKLLVYVIHPEGQRQQVGGVHLGRRAAYAALWKAINEDHGGARRFWQEMGGYVFTNESGNYQVVVDLTQPCLELDVESGAADTFVEARKQAARQARGEVG